MNYADYMDIILDISRVNSNPPGRVFLGYAREKAADKSEYPGLVVFSAYLLLTCGLTHSKIKHLYRDHI
jgi:hypothetical protein